MRRRSRRNRQPGGDQRVVDLEVAGQRQVDLIDHAIMLDLGALAIALVLDPLERQEVAMPADRQHVEPCSFGGLDRRLGINIVGEDDSRARLSAAACRTAAASP